MPPADKKGMGFLRKHWSLYGTEALIIVAVLLVGFISLNRSAIVQSETVGFFPNEIESLKNLKKHLLEAHRTQEIFVKSKQRNDLIQYNHQVMLINYEMSHLARSVGDRPAVLAQVKELNKELSSHFDVMNSMLEQVQKTKKTLRLPASHEVEQKLDSFSESKAFNKPIYYNFSYIMTGVATLLAFTLLSSLMRMRLLGKLRAKNRENNDKANLLETVINSLHEGLVITNAQGEFTHYNAAAQRIIGEHIKAIAVEKHAEDLGFHSADSQEILSLDELPMRRILHGETVEDQEVFVKNRAQPQGVYVLLSTQSFRNTRGAVAGSVTVFKDISQRKAIEQEWKRAREAALEASSKKSDFLAAMSHEIRTPMNGVIGMANLLAETDLSHTQKDYVQTIRKSAEALVFLINDILDHSKIEAGKIDLLSDPFNVKETAEEAVELLKPLALDKKIGLELLIDNSIQWGVRGDSGRIRQILVNLLGNAVKFTEQGKVQVIVKQVQKDQERELHFAVKDSGPGMTDEEQKQLFQRYFQTHTGTKAGGTGLGLSICRQLVDLMKGQIGVESLVGLGSTFWFKISLPLMNEEQIKNLPTQSFSMQFSGRILLAEDQPVNLRVAKTYLEKLGVEVVTAANGLLAYERFTEGRFDLVLMDCQMPIVDGFEATQKIREYENREDLGQTPVVALTADIKVGELEVYKTSGMNGFITKPIELRSLVNLLNEYLVRSVIDEQVIHNLSRYDVNGDSNLMGELIKDFDVSGKVLVEDFLRGYEELNLSRLQETAHALKGTAGTLGAYRLMELCEKLESAPSLEIAGPLIHEIRVQYTKSLTELKIILAKRTAA